MNINNNFKFDLHQKALVSVGKEGDQPEYFKCLIIANHNIVTRNLYTIRIINNELNSHNLFGFSKQIFVVYEKILKESNE